MNTYTWTEGVTRVAVLTGAGVSTDSGLPDYRGPQGIWTRDPSLAGLFTRENFLADASNRERFWKAFGRLHTHDVQPNAAHRALAELPIAHRIITQNVDGLHQKAGTAGRKVLELHGSLATVDCLDCHARIPTADVLARGESDPRCSCGGILQPSIVLFGQYLDAGLLAQARTIAAHAQLFLAIGSSLMVEPAAGLCAVAVESGARLVIVNRDPTPYDEVATEIICEPIGSAVPAICAALR